jgi:5-methylcytosine-specific restriction protein B
MPTVVRDQFARFASVIARYGAYIYAAVAVPTDVAAAKPVVTAFLDLYAWERGWQPLKAAAGEIDDLKNNLRRHLFPKTEKSEVVQLLRERRFVVLQGPPGTGKTRMADEIMAQDFAGHGRTVQFHPAVTYESFVAGISPDVDEQSLRFRVRSGWLAAAVNDAQKQDFLLVIDEINRGDLGRVLGEAIYLFEAKEIAEGKARSVHLPQALEDGKSTLSIPQGMYLLGTMNSADRSIAILDLAVRRRFAFVDVWPDLDVVRSQGIDLATDAFGKLQDIFAQFAPNDALVLMPGHAYFLAGDEQQFKRRMRYELIPLLEEYLVEGRLGPCETELEAYIDWLQGEVARDGQA